jgi:thiamine-monophosphate kinase
MPLGEFELIARYFSRSGARADVLLGVGDDAALLEVPPDRVLVAAVDTLVEGRHFLPDAPADSVGHQALAVNLSDLAAMGAEPAWALLSLSLPQADEAWLEGFASGLYALAGRHGVAVVGGDTVRGPRVVSITALGFVERGAALRRDGARVGDLVYVSGWPGEAAAGLELLQRGRAVAPVDALVRRCRYAEPRLALGRALRGVATAAMDVSDGLLGDLGKLCAASGVGARLELERLPVSGELAARHGAGDCERLVLAGGDDYELLFTLPDSAAAAAEAALARVCAVHCIGRIEAQAGVRCLRDGRPVRTGIAGYDHFA